MQVIPEFKLCDSRYFTFAYFSEQSYRIAQVCNLIFNVI